MIEPDEVTRSSVFISQTEPDALYSSVTGEGEGEGETPPAEPATEVKAQLSVKSKVLICIMPVPTLVLLISVL